jgi:hypothetical protein
VLDPDDVEALWAYVIGGEPGANVSTISFSRDLETVKVFWTTQPQPSIPMRQRVELPAEPSS